MSEITFIAPLVVGHGYDLAAYLGILAVSCVAWAATWAGKQVPGRHRKTRQ